MSPAEFYRRSGIGRGILSQPNYIVEDNLVKFFSVFPEVSPAWLVLGIGEPTQTYSTVRETLPNISALSSALSEPVAPYGSEKMERYAEEVKRLEEQKAKLTETKMRMMEEHMAMMDEKVRLMEKVIELQKRLLADMGVPAKTDANAEANTEASAAANTAASTAANIDATAAEKPKKKPTRLRPGSKVENPAVGGLVGDYIDLGLNSTFWAKWNIGASRPGDAGVHFAWGETVPNGEFTWATYAHLNHEQRKELALKESLSWGGDEVEEELDEQWRHMRYYTFEDGQTDCDWYDRDGYFFGDGLTKLDKSDDAAAANWGGSSCGRLPTAADFEELITKCHWEWKAFGEYAKDSCAGYLITGPNGNSIFLPAAGMGGILKPEYGGFRPGVGGLYWTSELSGEVSQGAQALQFTNGGHASVTVAERCLGFAIRPVMHVFRLKA